MNKYIIGLICLILSNLSLGQVNRYMVFFTDKDSPSYPYTLSDPTAFLTQKSIDRRVKQDISLNETDLPVDPSYVEGLKNSGADVYFTTKWMNGALVQMNNSLVGTIQSLSYVDSVALIAEGSRLSNEKIEVEVPDIFDPPPSVTSNTLLQLTILQANVMHEDGFHGEGMTIAVLDDGYTGVDRYEPFEHLWDENRIVAYRDFVENSGNVFRLGDHGTSVFSTIAAQYENDYYGTAYKADFILCITEEGGSEDRIEEFNWLIGAEYVDSLGADIINGSLGYRNFDISEHNYDYDDLDGKTTIVSQAAKLASDKGMVVVVSAGNSGDNPPNKWRYVSPPADAENILAVGSLNPDFSWTSFSSIGPTVDGRIKPDVVALGLGTAIVRGNGAVTSGNGTSFASPQMAGLAAGIWQANPTWTNIEVIEAIKGAGHKSHAPDTLLGNGAPFYSYAVEGKVLNVSDILDEKIRVYPNPFNGDRLFLKIEEALPEKMDVRLIDSEGKEILERKIISKKGSEIFELTLNGVDKGVYYLFLQSGNLSRTVKLINF